MSLQLSAPLRIEVRVRNESAKHQKAHRTIIHDVRFSEDEEEFVSMDSKWFFPGKESREQKKSSQGKPKEQTMNVMISFSSSGIFNGKLSENNTCDDYRNLSVVSISISTNNVCGAIRLVALLSNYVDMPRIRATFHHTKLLRLNF